MADAFILSIDQGTTGTTVLVVNASNKADLRIVGRSTISFPQHFPREDWVEHDLEEIWQSVIQACKEACKQAENEYRSFTRKSIIAIGITNQRETLCVYDRKTLKPLTRAIVWQCKRSSAICKQMKDEGLEQGIRNKTGLFLDPYFSGTKIKWLLESNSSLARKIHEGSAVFGTIDTFLMSRLGQGRDHVTEASNASRTLLYNIHKGEWDSELLQWMGLKSSSCLAEVRDSASVFTKTQGLKFLPDGIPVTGVLGDQQAALAGQRCFQIGEAKCTYGTGAFLLLNIGEHAVLSQNDLLTTVAWQLKGKRTYALEGSAFIAGAALQFLRDQLGILNNAYDSEQLSRNVSAAPSIYFVPALSGLGAPWWNPNARGAFLGLTRATTKAQLVRAALEGIAFEVCDLIECMQRDHSKNFRVLRVDGGAAANSMLLTIQAQFAQLTVERPHNLETTSMGAALIAALGAGIFGSLEEMQSNASIQASFAPASDAQSQALVQQQRAGWERAVKAIQVFAGL